MKQTDNTRLIKVTSRIFESIGNPEKLKTQIGATGIFYDYFIFGKLANPGIQFKFSRSNGINGCQIILKNGQDSYSVKFFDSRRRSVNKVAIFIGIPAEKIRHIFEETTGLSLHP